MKNLKSMTNLKSISFMSIKSSAFFKSSFLILSSLSALSCGGGGGGGGGGGTEGVRIVHAALDHAPVELIVSGGTTAQALQTAAYAEDKGFSSIAGGDSVLVVRSSLNGKVLGQTQVNNPGGAQIDVLLTQVTDGDPVVKSFSRERPSAAGGGCVRVINGIQDSSGLTLQISGSAGSSNVPFAGESGYVTAPAGAAISVNSAGSVRQAGTVPSGKCATIVASGIQSSFWVAKLYED